MKWQDIVNLSDDDLVAKGVAALGARRKMLKVFENVRAHCDANVSYAFIIHAKIRQHHDTKSNDDFPTLAEYSLLEQVVFSLLFCNLRAG